ncbi:hypothetical protein FSP39_001448 [Pinctada imbricata]|uniref:Glycosyltransferase n=1 Tax=Pinctada imbricata TaxID=66713 RepID=A0AA88YD90_PINIB|nr:hypothetical protein FSP39_001448 [Pinctada imbricata]
MIHGKFKDRIVFLSIVTVCVVIFIMLNIHVKYSNRNFPEEINFEKKERNSKSSNRIFVGIDKYDVSELGDFEVPNTVHYVWCYEHTIKYEQYLSIMSVWKLMRPDIIEFHCRYNVSEDDSYNMWLKELKNKIPGFVVRRMPEFWDFQQYGDCGIYFGIAVLHDRGGIYVSDNVTFTKSFRQYRRQNFTIGLDSRGDVSFVMSPRREDSLRKLAEVNSKHDLSFDSFKNTIQCSVANPNKLLLNSEDNSCIVLSNIHPVDIMYLNSTIGVIARKLTYGSPDVIQHKPLLPGKIPKYVHLVWYHRKDMTFMMYLSIRSALTILNPEKVFIHGDKELKGDYFDKIMKDPRVILVNREIPHYIFGHKVYYTQHRSDVIRADVLLKYGGIYMDWDVLWLKPVDDLISTGYDAIVNFDHNTRNDYPDSMNLGVLMAKQNSHYIQYWQDSLVNYKSKDFYHNALELPYKTYERYPSTVHIEKHLQVMCFLLKCHPIWNSQYRSLDQDPPFDWRTEAYAIHFTHPDPPEYANESALLNGSGRFAEIGKYILNKSNKFNKI